MSDKKLQVYIEGGDRNYSVLAASFAEECLLPEEADIVIFTGGADVSPSLYGEKELASTHVNPERDRHEVSLFQRLQRDDKKRAYVGICRGGQFLNVMNGGSLWQDVKGHGADHYVQDNTTKIIYKCSSTHHQQFRVPTPEVNTPYRILAVALDQQMNIRTKTEKFTPSPAPSHDGMDIEAMWYPGTRTLCFQPHPEFPGYPECKTLFLRYVQDYVIPSLTKEAV
jgi:gamma-glutamyl-gamma-aminobutyrate hydrolase PuuD